MHTVSNIKLYEAQQNKNKNKIAAKNVINLIFRLKYFNNIIIIIIIINYTYLFYLQRDEKYRS